jgi:uncharacterized protein with ParB-like and HNH nuclease domain
MPAASYEPYKYTLEQVLSATSPPLRVPEFQRDFSWEAKHVTDFWDDILDFDKRNPSLDNSCGYFLGTVVMVAHGKHNLVLDGQQRFATTTILLAVIRDRLRSLDITAADYIQRQWIAFDNPLDPSQQRIYKLELNVYDREFFRRVVQDEQGDHAARATRQSHKLILDAKRRLGEFIDEMLSREKGEAAQKDRLLRLSKALTQHFGVVAITSHDEDQAASIFETLNERGIGLSTADLLRSWIMSSTAKLSSRDEIVKLWDAIGEVHGSKRVETVIRTSWKSTHGDVKARALYREIKDNLQAHKITPFEYTRNLARDAAYLKKLSRGETDLESVNQAARDLADVKASSAYAALLAAKNVLKPNDCGKLAQGLIALALRHNVICGLEPGKYESTVYECAKAISESRSLEPGLQVLRALSPSNEDVSRSLKRLKFLPKRSRAAHVVLRGIEANRPHTGETKVASKMKVHLEHIYPQKPTNGKRLPQHDKHVYLLGNLTLLAGKLNREASNLPYASKKKKYTISELLITSELPKKHVKWGRQPILERQERLAREILKVWPQELIQ